MKKYFKYILAAIIMVLLVCALCACGEKPQEEEREMQLAAPTNFSISGNNLYWDEVENADYYTVRYGDTERTLTTNSITLPQASQTQTFNISVKASSYNKKYLKSEWAEYSYTYEVQEPATKALKYTLLEDGSGYEVERAYKDVNLGLDGRVVIPDCYNSLPVKKIADYAFCSNELVLAGGNAKKNKVTTSFKLPAYLEEIGECAFCDCVAFKEIELPQGLKSIGDVAFGGCSMLQSIVIPDGITELAMSIFRDCTSLTSVSIPNSVNSFAGLTFLRCAAMEEIQLPENLVDIGSQTFKDCVNLKELTIPDSVTKIGAATFKGCISLKKIVIPNSVKTINNEAFDGCSKLSEITISENIQYFGMRVFNGTAWYENQSDGYLTLREDMLYGYKGQMAEGTVIEKLPSQVKYIVSGAFSGCEHLESINLTGVKLLGERIFEDCTALKNVTLPSDITEIPSRTFNKCKALMTINMSEGVVSLGDFAFYQCGLTRLILPSTLNEISDTAFSSCKNLSEIFYIGTQEQWENATVQVNFDAYGNRGLKNATKYFYSETQPEGDGSYWHYVDGEVVIWNNDKQ